MQNNTGSGNPNANTGGINAGRNTDTAMEEAAAFANIEIERVQQEEDRNDAVSPFSDADGSSDSPAHRHIHGGGGGGVAEQAPSAPSYGMLSANMTARNNATKQHESTPSPLPPPPSSTSATNTATNFYLTNVSVDEGSYSSPRPLHSSNSVAYRTHPQALVTTPQAGGGGEGVAKLSAATPAAAATAGPTSSTASASPSPTKQPYALGPPSRKQRVNLDRMLNLMKEEEEAAEVDEDEADTPIAITTTDVNNRKKPEKSAEQGAPTSATASSPTMGLVASQMRTAEAIAILSAQHQKQQTKQQRYDGRGVGGGGGGGSSGSSSSFRGGSAANTNNASTNSSGVGGVVGGGGYHPSLHQHHHRGGGGGGSVEREDIIVNDNVSIVSSSSSNKNARQDKQKRQSQQQRQRDSVSSQRVSAFANSSSIRGGSYQPQQQLLNTSYNPSYNASLPINTVNNNAPTTPLPESSIILQSSKKKPSTLMFSIDRAALAKMRKERGMSVEEGPIAAFSRNTSAATSPSVAAAAAPSPTSRRSIVGGGVFASMSNATTPNYPTQQRQQQPTADNEDVSSSSSSTSSAADGGGGDGGGKEGGGKSMSNGDDLRGSGLLERKSSKKRASSTSKSGGGGSSAQQSKPSKHKRRSGGGMGYTPPTVSSSPDGTAAANVVVIDGGVIGDNNVGYGMEGGGEDDVMLKSFGSDAFPKSNNNPPSAVAGANTTTDPALHSTAVTVGDVIVSTTTTTGDAAAVTGELVTAQQKQQDQNNNEGEEGEEGEHQITHEELKQFFLEITLRELSPLRRLHNILYNKAILSSDAMIAKIYNFVHIAFVIFAIVQSIVLSMPEWYLNTIDVNSVGFVLESVTAAFFTLDFIARVISATSWRRLIGLSPLIDFLSFAGYFIEVFYFLATPDNVVSPDGIIILRVLRILRIFRVFKLMRQHKGVQLLMEVIRVSTKSLVLLAVLILVSIMIFSSVLFSLEQIASDFNEAENRWHGSDGSISCFQSIPETFLFICTTMCTVGYGDCTPKSWYGRAWTAIVMFSGALVLSFPNILIGANFSLVHRQLAEQEAKKRLGRYFRKVRMVVRFIRMWREFRLKGYVAMLGRPPPAHQHGLHSPTGARPLTSPHGTTAMIPMDLDEGGGAKKGVSSATSNGQAILSHDGQKTAAGAVKINGGFSSGNFVPIPAGGNALATPLRARRMKYFMFKVADFVADHNLHDTTERALAGAIDTIVLNGVSLLSVMQRLLEVFSGTATIDELVTMYFYLPMSDAERQNCVVLEGARGGNTITLLGPAPLISNSSNPQFQQRPMSSSSRSRSSLRDTPASPPPMVTKDTLFEIILRGATAQLLSFYVINRNEKQGMICLTKKGVDLLQNFEEISGGGGGGKGGGAGPRVPRAALGSSLTIKREPQHHHQQHSPPTPLPCLRCFEEARELWHQTTKCTLYDFLMTATSMNAAMLMAAANPPMSSRGGGGGGATTATAAAPLLVVGSQMDGYFNWQIAQSRLRKREMYVGGAPSTTIVVGGGGGGANQPAYARRLSAIGAVLGIDFEKSGGESAAASEGNNNNKLPLAPPMRSPRRISPAPSRRESAVGAGGEGLDPIFTIQTSDANNDNAAVAKFAFPHSPRPPPSPSRTSSFSLLQHQHHLVFNLGSTSPLPYEDAKNINAEAVFGNLALLRQRQMEREEQRQRRRREREQQQGGEQQKQQQSIVAGDEGAALTTATSAHLKPPTALHKPNCQCRYCNLQWGLTNAPLRLAAGGGGAGEGVSATGANGNNTNNAVLSAAASPSACSYDYCFAPDEDLLLLELEYAQQSIEILRLERALGELMKEKATLGL